MKTKKIAVTIFITALMLGSSQGAWAQSSITGKINFEGEAPVPKPVNFGAEKQCAIVHGDKPPLQEEILVNEDKTLRNVLIYVKEGVTDTFDVPKEPVEVDQKGCVFSPHVAVVRAGQTVRFKNSDSLLHNVRSVSKAGQTFNIAQPIQGMKTDKVFNTPEIGIQLRCDVHFWMASYLHVLSHPYYAVTSDGGTFTLSGLPPGTYTIEAWHEKLGTKSEVVTIAEGESKTIDFTFAKQ